MYVHIKWCVHTYTMVIFTLFIYLQLSLFNLINNKFLVLHGNEDFIYTLELMVHGLQSKLHS